MQQPYVIAAQLLDGMTKINRVWCTNKHSVSPITFKFAKEKHVKDQERDKNMTKIMTQLDILSKYVMGACVRSVNVFGVGCANHEEAMFEALANKKVKFLTNQRGYYSANYQRKGDSQGWRRNNVWRDCDREWRDRNPTLK